MAHILRIVLLFFIWQCNDNSGDPQSPTSEPSPTDGGDECPQLALDAFEQHIQPAIDASCSDSACHGIDADPPGGGFELLKKENDETFIINRAKMLSYSITSGKKLSDDGELLQKIGDDDEASHYGGNQVALGHITEEGITAWVKAEQKCSN